MTAEELLARAADRVEKGWIQGAMVDMIVGGAPFAFCTMGAIAYDYSSWDSLEKDKAISAVAHEIAGIPVHPISARGVIIDWNDTPGRIKEEVSTLLRNSKRHL